MKSKFCWTPSCKQTTTSSPYIINFNLSDNACSNIQRNYLIYVRPRPLLSPPSLGCMNIKASNKIDFTISPITVSANNFKQYNVYRKQGKYGTFTLIDSIKNSAITSYTDNTVTTTDTTLYQYYIKSVNSCNYEGAQSNTIGISFPLIKDTLVFSKTTVAIQLKASGSSTGRYRWYKT